MEELRNYLLEKGQIDLFESILAFFNHPTQAGYELIAEQASAEAICLYSENLLPLIDLYKSDKHRFYQTVTMGQAIIWQEILKTYNALKLLETKIIV
ncbi:MAG: hypothetical protein ACM3UZ_10015 [Acidobacteriota bacterium]